ncbi:CBS domain-containing protein [uncultured Friedmanniella sp.]|uniref:CBS domain-containing protein n=1 Tax=uncultured Friedmanniella sp. TaxID=335381 RepID=UPI0035CA5A13
MRIQDILSVKGSDVVSVRPESSVADLVALLDRRNLGAVVVSTDGRTIAGIVSERDVIRRLSHGTDFLTGSVAAIMTTDVHSCSAADTVELLMNEMTDRRIRHLPVLDDQHELAGIVSIGDLVKSQISQLQFERDQLEGYVAG